MIGDGGRKWKGFYNSLTGKCLGFKFDSTEYVFVECFEF